MAEASGPLPCEFIGSADAYGLGIRIGAYTQWFASVLAYTLSDGEAEAMRSVNTCFQLAMFVSLAFWTTSSSETLHAVEAFIMLLLCFGGVSACQQWSRQPLRRTRGSDAFSVRGLGNFARNLVATGACSYGIWLTIRGEQYLERGTTCRTRVFFFAPVNLFGWYKYVLLVVFSLGAICGAAMIAVGFFGAYSQFHDWTNDWTDPGSNTEEDSEYRPSIAVLATASLGLGVFVLAIELTIIWNGISGVQSCDSVGQLFPLIVGVAGLSRIIWCFASALLLGKISFRQGTL